MTRRVDPVEFIAHHGVVLASVKGPVPNLAETIAGEPIQDSWWAHKKGTEIFKALEQLVRIAGELKKDQVTATGEHRDVQTPFPKWVSAEVRRPPKVFRKRSR